MAEYPEIETLIPHRGEMCLIDEVTKRPTPDSIVCSTRVPDDHPLVQPGLGLPNVLRVEMAAQAVAALVSLALLDSRQAHDPTAVGYLVGIQKVVFSTPWLPSAETLLVRASASGSAGALTRFDISVSRAARADQTQLLGGVISVFRTHRSDSPESFRTTAFSLRSAD